MATTGVATLAKSVGEGALPADAGRARWCGSRFGLEHAGFGEGTDSPTVLATVATTGMHLPATPRNAVIRMHREQFPVKNFGPASE